MGEFVEAENFRVWEIRRTCRWGSWDGHIGLVVEEICNKDNWNQGVWRLVRKECKRIVYCGVSRRGDRKKLKPGFKSESYILSGKGKQPFISFDENFHLLWIWQFSVVTESSSLWNGKFYIPMSSCQWNSIVRKMLFIFSPILLHFSSKKSD